MSKNNVVTIVEDDAAIANMYRIKFETAGLKVNVAENGKEGLKIIKDELPGLVLLDLMMPEMNGDEMLRLMRQEEWGKDLEVIILTNMSAQEAPSELKQLGVESFIVKAEMTPKQVLDFVEEKLSS